MLIRHYAKFIIGTHLNRNVTLGFIACQLKGFHLKTYNAKRNLITHRRMFYAAKA